jgi:hypothetical protein
MNKNFLFRGILALLIVSVIILLQKCGSDDLNAPQEFMAGTITFNDTLFMATSNGHYAVSIFGDSTNPFSHTPVRSDSLNISISNNVATSYWKMNSLESRSYYIGATWINRSTGAITVLGEYGCATPPSCTTPTKVDFPNYAGTAQLNFNALTH